MVGLAAKGLDAGFNIIIVLAGDKMIFVIKQQNALTDLLMVEKKLEITKHIGQLTSLLLVYLEKQRAL